MNETQLVYEQMRCKIQTLEKENADLKEEINKIAFARGNLEEENAKLERKLEQTEKDLADYQFNYPTIKELQKENAELRNNGFTVSAMTEQQLKVALEKGEQLEKENAELKGLKDVATLIRANNDTVITLMQLNNMLVSKSQQLTKAKEIIREFVQWATWQGSNCPNFKSIQDRAEAFLNSEVEKCGQ